MLHPSTHIRRWVFAASIALLAQACDCGSKPGSDGGADADVEDDATVTMDGGAFDAGSDAGDAGGPDGGDAGEDAGPVGLRLIHANVPGAASASSTNYRLVRTHGRGARGSSMSFSQRDAVHGGGQP